MSSFITRVERSGNIFFRVTGLIRSGQLQWADRPLWYDIYASAPPLTSPDWNVKLPKYDEPVRQLFYKEDEIRAAFYKRFKVSGVINVTSPQASVSQMFIHEFEKHKEMPEHQQSSFENTFDLTEKKLRESGIDLK